ncbi:hypothetical protein Patl1_06404 [Pistacia atlantica]|uniref:Uncharacterized protein n=1 Tax=Pistacia atlantica TaxID=434234 RepID=A0ACC1BS41_9ROSI|nr:hypothetical protein Patl1_06404 [Pistacia atlantica]
MAIGLMEVLLVNAKGLSDTDFLGDVDPYVVMQYKGQERKSSVAQGYQKCFQIARSAFKKKYVHTVIICAGQGGNPSWNEKFTFRVEYPGCGGQYKLVLKIMDKDTFTHDDFLGEAT